MDAGAQGRGPRRLDGHRTEACFCLVVKARTSRGRLPAARKRHGTRRANSRGRCTSLTRSGHFTPSSRAHPRCMTSCGPEASACISWSPCWRTAANSSSTRRIYPGFHSRTATYRKDRLSLPRLLPETVGQIQALPLGRIGAFDARPRHRHVRRWRRRMPRQSDPRHPNPVRNLRKDQSRLPRPDSIAIEDFANREDEDVLLVPKAGEMLYQLREPATWARGKR